MTNLTLVNPHTVYVVILEDDPREAGGLQRTLEDLGMSAKVAQDYKTFQVCIRTSQIDIASIDWMIDDVAQGLQALGFLQKEQPLAARIVYTQLTSVSDLARNRGADFVICKGLLPDNQEYVQTICQGMELTLLRRIDACLRTLNTSTLPALPEHGEIDKGTKQQLLQKARQKLRHADINESIRSTLSELLKRQFDWEHKIQAAIR